MNLSDLAAIEGSIKLRGKVYPFQPITANDRHLIIEVFPEPEVMVKPHPMYGSADRTAPLVPDKTNPTYLRKCDVRDTSVAAAELAMSLMLKMDDGTSYKRGGDDNANRKWIEAATKAVLGTCHDAEVLAAIGQIRSELARATSSEEIRKN